MNKLTKDEMALYIKPANPKTGVKAITESDLLEIDLDKVIEINEPIFIDGSIITDKKGSKLFKYDSFCPRAGSIYLKPSFAGRQILMGRVGRKLFFSNGRWFA